MSNPTVGKTNLSLEGEKLLVVERLFDAPRDLVYECYTSADHIKRWWGPNEFPTVYCTIDFRVGGTWHYCMKGPDGTEAWGIGTYTEIVRPEVLAYRDAFSDEKGSIVPPEMDIRMTFTEANGQTLVRSSSAFADSESRQAVLDMGMEEGMNQTLDHLDTYLEELKAAAR